MLAQRLGMLVALLLVMSSPLEAARIVNVTVEPKLDEGKQLINVELLMDRGEAAVEIEVLAVLFDEATVPPLRPILSNNPATRSPTGQYVAKTTIVQQNQVRLQQATIDVPLDHLKLAAGLHQIAYQVRILQDGKPIELVCTPAEMVTRRQGGSRHGTQDGDRDGEGGPAAETGRRSAARRRRPARDGAGGDDGPRAGVEAGAARRCRSSRAASTRRCSRSRRRRRSRSTIRTSPTRSATCSRCLGRRRGRSASISPRTATLRTPAARDASRFGNDVGELTLWLGDCRHPGAQDARRAAAVAGEAAADAAGQLHGRRAHQHDAPTIFIRRSATRSGRRQAADRRRRTTSCCSSTGSTTAFGFRACGSRKWCTTRGSRAGRCSSVGRPTAAIVCSTSWRGC